MKIVVKKGLDIPIAGKPQGRLKELSPPKEISLNMGEFDNLRFKVLVKVGDRVKIGQPLVENKAYFGQNFVSPACGIVKEIRRGLKRKLLDIVVELSEREEFFEYGPFDLRAASREQLVGLFMERGIFPHLRLRPFDLVPGPNHIPRDIFVSALETLPYAPPSELLIDGNEKIFQAGLDTLAKMTTGKVHLAYKEGSDCKAFTEAYNVEKHSVIGPHPAANPSVHIQRLSPIRSAQDYVWTTSVIGVLTIGEMVSRGRYFINRVISIAGNGIIPEAQGYYLARAGFPIQNLIENRTVRQLLRFISGDPLKGTKVEQQDFLGFYDNAFTALPVNVKRESFHFLRLGVHKYTATHTYYSGLVKPPKEGYPLDTNQHGEERSFVDPDVYEKVMPLQIPTMLLIKAILSEDYELAELLGLLEVAPEDFALPTFICPSKIEMVDIVREGLRRYSKEMGF